MTCQLDFASQKHAGAVGWLPLPSLEDELSEHRDGRSSRERRRRASPKPQPSPAACALPASFVATAARQNIDRRIRRRRRNGEAEHAMKLVIAHIASVLSAQLPPHIAETHGGSRLDRHQNLSPKMLTTRRSASGQRRGWMCGWARNYVASY